MCSYWGAHSKHTAERHAINNHNKIEDNVWTLWYAYSKTWKYPEVYIEQRWRPRKYPKLPELCQGAWSLGSSRRHMYNLEVLPKRFQEYSLNRGKKVPRKGFCHWRNSHRDGTWFNVLGGPAKFWPCWWERVTHFAQGLLPKNCHKFQKYHCRKRHFAYLTMMFSTHNRFDFV